jgi:RNA polymerase sigma factor (sigma-70 family)
MDKKSTERIDALLVAYRDTPEAQRTNSQTSALWKMLDKIAANRVKKYFRWEDPEVVGTAVSKGLMGLGEFKGKSKLLGWFLRVVDNECLEALSKRYQRAEVEIGLLPENAFTAEIDWGLLEDVAPSLKADEQELLKMKLEGYTEAEIARALGQPAKSVHARLLALVRSLRRRLS